MTRGLVLLILGVLFNVLGYFIRDHSLGHYGWAMILGTALFGIGFLSIFYSLVRKVERQAILEERASEANKMGSRESVEH